MEIMQATESRYQAADRGSKKLTSLLERSMTANQTTGPASSASFSNPNAERWFHETFEELEKKFKKHIREEFSDMQREIAANFMDVEALEEKLEDVDAKFDILGYDMGILVEGKIEEKLEEMFKTFEENMEKQIEERLDEIDTEFKILGDNIGEKLDKKLEAFEEKFDDEFTDFEEGFGKEFENLQMRIQGFADETEECGAKVWTHMHDTNDTLKVITKKLESSAERIEAIERKLGEFEKVDQECNKVFGEIITIINEGTGFLNKAVETFDESFDALNRS